MKVTVLILLTVLIGITFSISCRNSPCPNNQFCHPDNECRAAPYRNCRTNSECIVSNYPICSDLGICVKCRGDSDCSNGMRCFDKGFQCLAPPGSPNCIDNSDCLVATSPLCVPSSDTTTYGVCGPDACQKNSQCTLSKDKPRCDTQTSKCAPCEFDADCFTGFNNNVFLSRCINQKCVDYNTNLGQCINYLECPFIDNRPIVCYIENGKSVGTCKECVESKDCPNTKPVCNNFVCGPCKLNSDCPNPRSVCKDQQCESLGPDQCLSNSDCPPTEKPDNKVCIRDGSNQIGNCVYGCNKDSDCPLMSDPNQKKILCANKKCIEGCLPNPDDVLKSVHCKNSSIPRCNTIYNIDNLGVGKCDVECRTNFDCRLDKDDTLKALCVKEKCINPGCKVNADCHVNVDKPTCNIATQACRACVTAADCTGNPSGPKCVSGTCKCTTTADCSLKGQGNVCDQTGVCSCLSSSDCKVANIKACVDSPIFNVKTCGNCSVDTDCSSDRSAICNFNLPSSRCVTVDCKKSTSGSAVIGGACGCINDSHCLSLPNTPACDCAASKCVSCLKDIHCENYQRCTDAKKCVSMKCAQDSDCQTNRGRSSETRCSDAGVCVPFSDTTKCVNSVVPNLLNG